MADQDRSLAIGVGKPFGGYLGAKYSLNRENYKFYGSFGLLGYTQHTGMRPGYGVGFDRRILQSNSSVGLYIGTVSSAAGVFYGHSSSVVYHGVAINYLYHFSGFNSKTWILGLSAYIGESSGTNYYWDEQETGWFISAGYQF